MRYFQNFFSRRKLINFWSEQNRDPLKFWEKNKEKKAYIYYPSYPNPRVGRTAHASGYYISSADAKAAELLAQTLSNLGFKCERLTTEKIDTKHPIPSGDGIVILVCGPKLDTTTNRVVYDPWTGGNPISSWFYLRYHKSIGIKLSYNHHSGRKEYEIPDDGSTITIHDEPPDKGIDSGLLVKLKIDGRLYFLCWGIHETATLGAVSLALDPGFLNKSKQFHSPDILAVVTAHKNNDTINPTAKWYDLNIITSPDRETKPAPFKLNEYLDIETPVYGLSYLWATKENIEKVKNGNYAQLAPVAAEFDTSLSCPYNCIWCPYKADRTGTVLEDMNTALQIVEKLNELSIKLIVLTGGGEPLMSKHVETIVERCRHHEMNIILYTNGLLLDDLRAYHLMSRGISEIRISLDDLSSVENYNAVHGINTNTAMEIVEKNTRKLIELRAQNGFNTRIGASFLVSDKTLHNLEKSVETLSKWLDEVGPFDYVIIRPAVKYWPDRTELSNALLNFREDDVEKLKKAARQFKVKGAARHIFISWQRFKDINHSNSNAYSKCRASTLWMNIGPDGKVYLCCETKHKSDFSLGNILSSSISHLQKETLGKVSNDAFLNRCPVLLCKPSALNQLFNDIESERRKYKEISANTCDWLDQLSAYNKDTEILIPSVSGIYEEYNVEY
jgi:MoaA/NifB/PqqE/SkfB family radical SAM enzyme